MRQERLTLYKIDLKYIRNLAKVDDRVMLISPQINKCMRPFVGIVIVCNDKRYCIPLSSPKNKHKDMKNSVDFMKIYDGDKLIGVLNFNNMIPVNEKVIVPLDMKIRSGDTAPIKYYKVLCAKQLKWCQQHQENIIHRANRLYNLITSGNTSHDLKKRCCDFNKLEKTLTKMESKNY